MKKEKVDFWFNLEEPRQKALADQCGSTTSYMEQLAYGYKRAGASLAKAINDNTQGAWPKHELRPDLFDQPAGES